MNRTNPDTERTADGHWRCKKCGGIDWCNCYEDGAPDPICDCGWPGYACQCFAEELEAELNRLCFPKIVHLNGKEYDRWIKQGGTSPEAIESHQVGKTICIASAPAYSSDKGLITVESLRVQQEEFQPTPILDPDGNVIGIVNEVKLDGNKLVGVIEPSTNAK